MTYLFQLIDLPTGSLEKAGVSSTMKMAAPAGFMIVMMHPMGEVFGEPTEQHPKGEKKTRILLCMVEQPKIVPGGIVR